MAGKFSDLTKGFTPERRKRIEAAKAALRRERTRRSKSFLAGEAIAAYVARELEIIEGVERGLEDMKAGRVVPHDEAMRRIRAVIEKAK